MCCFFFSWGPEGVEKESTSSGGDQTIFIGMDTYAMTTIHTCKANNNKNKLTVDIFYSNKLKISGDPIFQSIDNFTLEVSKMENMEFFPNAR